jgi:hypothetical protein
MLPPDPYIKKEKSGLSVASVAPIAIHAYTPPTLLPLLEGEDAETSEAGREGDTLGRAEDEE